MCNVTLCCLYWHKCPHVTDLQSKSTSRSGHVLLSGGEATGGRFSSISACALFANSPQPRYAPRPSSSSVGAPQEGAERGRSSAPGQVCGSALPSPGQRSFPSCGDSSSPAAEVGEAPKRYGQVSHRCKWLINVPDDYTLKIILTRCVEMLRK